MAETSPEPLVVPDELAPRVRAVAAEEGMGAEKALTWLLALVLDAVEQSPRRSGRWMLAFLETDDGPTPPTGLEKVFDEFPRWAADRVPLSKRDRSGADDQTSEAAGEDQAQATQEAPSCDLCVLRRDDGANALVEVMTVTGEAVVHVWRGDQRAEQALPLACHEAWIDMGARVWDRLMKAADELADGLPATDGGDIAETPPDPSEPDANH